MLVLYEPIYTYHIHINFIHSLYFAEKKEKKKTNLHTWHIENKTANVISFSFGHFFFFLQFNSIQFQVMISFFYFFSCSSYEKKKLFIHSWFQRMQFCVMHFNQNPSGWILTMNLNWAKCIDWEEEEKKNNWTGEKRWQDGNLIMYGMMPI